MVHFFPESVVYPLVHHKKSKSGKITIDKTDTTDIILYVENNRLAAIGISSFYILLPYFVLNCYYHIANYFFSIFIDPSFVCLSLVILFFNILLANGFRFSSYHLFSFFAYFWKFSVK